MTVISSPWLAIPVGHYAIIDPHNTATVTYWRRKDIKSKRGSRPAFDPWPLKARYGPMLYNRDVPTELHGDPRREWIRNWYASNFASC